MNIWHAILAQLGIARMRIPKALRLVTVGEAKKQREAACRAMGYRRRQAEIEKARALEAQWKRMDPILDDWAVSRFRRNDDGSYRVMVDFDPRLFGSCTHETQRDLARYVGMRVEKEIATARFIRKADAEEARDRRRSLPPFGSDYFRSAQP